LDMITKGPRGFWMSARMRTDFARLHQTIATSGNISPRVLSRLFSVFLDYDDNRRKNTNCGAPLRKSRSGNRLLSAVNYGPWSNPKAS